MTLPTKNMRREYRSIAKSAPWKWVEGTSNGIRTGEWYLYLAGNRIAKVVPDSFRYKALCVGFLVATRSTLNAAKQAAVDATMAWLNEASLAITPYPEEPTK